MAIQRDYISPPVGLNFEEFMEWLDEDIRAEWVDGEIVTISPASRPHQEITDFLTKVLGTYVEEKDLGVLLSAPFVMRMGNVAREPDLLFVSKKHEDRLEDTYVEGAADLVVEVVSPESRGRDRFDKFQEYEEHGVREYWLIDPEEESAEFYRNRDGQFNRSPTNDIYRSDVLTGLEFQVDWLWEGPLPSLLDVLEELDLTDSR